jgi:hypothetical protein
MCSSSSSVGGSSSRSGSIIITGVGENGEWGTVGNAGQLIFHKWYVIKQFVQVLLPSISHNKPCFSFVFGFHMRTTKSF